VLAVKTFAPAVNQPFVTSGNRCMALRLSSRGKVRVLARDCRALVSHDLACHEVCEIDYVTRISHYCDEKFTLI
jgi:hypothetical protein